MLFGRRIYVGRMHTIHNVCMIIMHFEGYCDDFDTMLSGISHGGAMPDIHGGFLGSPQL